MPNVAMTESSLSQQPSFPIFPNFLPNPGRILPALTFNDCDPLYVNAGRILPGFGRKFGNIGKLEQCNLFSVANFSDSDKVSATSVQVAF